MSVRSKRRARVNLYAASKFCFELILIQIELVFLISLPGKIHTQTPYISQSSLFPYKIDNIIWNFLQNNLKNRHISQMMARNVCSVLCVPNCISSWAQPTYQKISIEKNYSKFPTCNQQELEMFNRLTANIGCLPLMRWLKAFEHILLPINFLNWIHIQSEKHDQFWFGISFFSLLIDNYCVLLKQTVYLKVDFDYLFTRFIIHIIYFYHYYNTIYAEWKSWWLIIHFDWKKLILWAKYLKLNNK